MKLRIAKDLIERIIDLTKQRCFKGEKMLKRHVPSHPAFAVIGKTRTLIWEDGLHAHKRPTAVYDPRSRPRFASVSGPRSTSNYDYRESSSGSKAKYHFLPGWLEPGLDHHYCELIYHKLQKFDHIFLVGGGVGWWSGINNFIRFVETEHEEFPGRIYPARYFRLTDFPEEKLMEIFRKMKADHL